MRVLPGGVLKIHLPPPCVAFHEWLKVGRAHLNVCCLSGAGLREAIRRQLLNAQCLAKCARRPAPHGADDGWTERSGAIGRIS